MTFGEFCQKLQAYFGPDSVGEVERLKEADTYLAGLCSVRYPASE